MPIAAILQALQLVRDAFAAVEAGEPTNEQLELHTAVMQSKVDDAIAMIDKAFAEKGQQQP